MVASEVKDLALQTARDRGNCCPDHDNAAGTDKAVSAIADISHTVGEMDSTTASVAAAAEQQAAATQEIRRAVAEAAEGTEEAEPSGWHARGSGQTAQSAAALRSASGRLTHQAQAMRAQVTTFF